MPAQIACEALQVGDIVYVTENEEIPADLVLLKTSNTTGTVPHQMSYIETANVDGETNLKERMALPETAQLSVDALMRFTCVIECANPNKRIYQFDSTLHMAPGQSQNCVLSLSASQLLLQATYLRHTRYGHDMTRGDVFAQLGVCIPTECVYASVGWDDVWARFSWIYGAVVYSGHDTKVGQNKLATVPTTKRTVLDRRINLATALIFGLQLVVIIVLGMLGNASMTEQKPTVCSPMSWGVLAL